MHAQRIHQMQVVFAPEEDRLQLRINTQARTEFRFWLTRRFVKRLWPGLVQAMESQAQSAAVTPPVDPTARATILDFTHQQAIAQTDFSTKFLETPSETPLGPLPILVTRARIEPREPGGGYMVSFHPEGSYGIEVAMDPRLLHSFCKLLADAVSKADWDLSLPSSVSRELSDAGGHYPPAGYTIN